MSRNNMKSSAPMPYFSLVRNHEEKTADIYIFGDIAQNRGGLAGLFQSSSDQSSYDLANQVAGIPEDYDITVHINSNGGELKEGLGIYNVLKERNVTTICEGFAASAGSIIFCAGKTRIMQPASLLFIHQAQMEASGNSDDFAKASEDLRIVTAAAVEAYKEAGVVVDDEQLGAMLKAETWITPEEAVAMGFATEISQQEDEEDGIITNDAMKSVMSAVKRHPVTFELKLSDENNALETLERFSDIMEAHGDFLDLAQKAFEAINKDPGLLIKLKTIADIVIAANPTPISPAEVGNKGFFGFVRKGQY